MIDDIIFDLSEALSEKGYKNVKTFINMEGDRVATLDIKEGTVLITADLL